jgi:hypothetical protein
VGDNMSHAGFVATNATVKLRMGTQHVRARTPAPSRSRQRCSASATADVYVSTAACTS